MNFDRVSLKGYVHNAVLWIHARSNGTNTSEPPRYVNNALTVMLVNVAFMLNRPTARRRALERTLESIVAI